MEQMEMHWCVCQLPIISQHTHKKEKSNQQKETKSKWKKKQAEQTQRKF